MRYPSSRGFFLIEVVVVSAIVAAVLVLLLGSVQDSVQVSKRSLERTRAAYLLEEGAEATKAIRDGAWTNITALTSGSAYYLSWSGTAWAFTTTPNAIDGFTRTIIVADVGRSGSDDIVATGGTNDPGTKKCTVSVSWNTSSGTQTELLSFYISNIN